MYLQEAIAAYEAFRAAGQGPIDALVNAALAGFIALGAFNYGEAEATEEAEEQCKGAEGIANALRHALGSAALTRAFGREVAKKIMDSHEEGSEDLVDTQIDKYNNDEGYDIGEESSSLDEIKQRVVKAKEDGDLITDRHDPRIEPPRKEEQPVPPSPSAPPAPVDWRNPTDPRAIPPTATYQPLPPGW
jgi:hypothetical protein